MEDNECKLLSGINCDRNHRATCIQGSCNNTTSNCECDGDRFKSVNKTGVSDMYMPWRKVRLWLNFICRRHIWRRLYVPKTTRPFVHLQWLQGANCVQGICQCDTSAHFQPETQTCDQRRAYGETHLAAFINKNIIFIKCEINAGLNLPSVQYRASVPSDHTTLNIKLNKVPVSQKPGKRLIILAFICHTTTRPSKTNAHYG